MTQKKNKKKYKLYSYFFLIFILIALAIYTYLNIYKIKNKKNTVIKNILPSTSSNDLLASKSSDLEISDNNDNESNPISPTLGNEKQEEDVIPPLEENENNTTNYANILITRNLNEINQQLTEISNSLNNSQKQSRNETKLITSLNFQIINALEKGKRFAGIIDVLISKINDPEIKKALIDIQSISDNNEIPTTQKLKNIYNDSLYQEIYLQSLKENKQLLKYYFNRLFFIKNSDNKKFSKDDIRTTLNNINIYLEKNQLQETIKEIQSLGINPSPDLLIWIDNLELRKQANEVIQILTTRLKSE